MNTKQVLKAAIGTGELINITYLGGSEPGKSRMIMPMQIIDDKVQAKCYTSNMVKSFLIEKIIINQTDTISYTGIPENHEPETLPKAIEPFLDKLKAQGWDKVIVNEHETALFTHFKNGKLKKTPSVSISFNANDYEGKPSARPWYVQGHSFKYLSKAVQKFMDFANEQANNLMILPKSAVKPRLFKEKNFDYL